MGTHVVFADESGTMGECPCYAIGALAVPAAVHEKFLAAFAQLADRHHVKHEVKWNDVGNNYGVINFVLDWMHLIQLTALTYNAIVVKKGAYRKWSNPGADRDEAFYTTYTLLMNHLAGKRVGEYDVYIDQRPDRYPKHDEAMEIISNHMLARTPSSSRISFVRKPDSKLVPGIQIADVLTGAINASHREYLDSSFRLQRGKRVLMDRLAQMLGWDALWYDTMPNATFNIWHFPQEGYRATPRTRAVRISSEVSYVSEEDLGAKA
jgi:hypothetical protein